ncbi:MAG: hypothetical protein ACLQPD_14505 [Desulfomonilaceae bacterium]
MRFVKRLIELAFIILIISLFMKNKDLEFQITYFGLSEPVRMAFWELVTLCVSIGIIIAALGDFVTQLKWRNARRRMIKAEQEHQAEVGRLSAIVKGLEAENARLSKDLEQKHSENTSSQSTESYSDLGGPAGSQSEF